MEKLTSSIIMLVGSIRILSLATFMLFSSIIHSQTSRTSISPGISFGFGGYGDNSYNRPTDSQGGVSLYLGFDLVMHKLDTVYYSRYMHNNIRLRYINHFSTIHESQILHHADFSLLYGWSFGKAIQLNFSSGGGIASISKEVVSAYSLSSGRPPSYEIISYFRPCISIDFGISIVSNKNFAVGINGFTNINNIKSKTGVALKFDFGKRR